MSLPKVLVGVTTYDGKDYIFDKNYNLVSNLTYPNYDFIYVDNSKSQNYVNKLRRKGYKHIHHIKRGGELDESTNNSRMALAKSQNYIRKVFLEGDYDYLLLVEADNLPPRDIIQRLMRHAKPVVGVWYWIGTDGIKLPCIFLNHRMHNGLMGTRMIGTVPQPDGKKLLDYSEVSKYYRTGLRKVHGVGFGTTLIKRDVLKKQLFWYDERFDNKHSDVYFFMNLDVAKIPVYCDTDIEVPHFPSKWDEVADR